MADYKIEVKPWMLKKSSDSFTFMRDRNNDIPMPLMVMYGTKIGEAPKMIKVSLHGDIKQRITNRCMLCGKVITNPVSQYFGMGPKCGGHNYTNPFASEEALDNAVAAYRERLAKITWIGWIPYSAILNIDDDVNVIEKAAEMPFEITSDSEYLFGDGDSASYSKNMPVIKSRIGTPVKGTDDFSVFLSFRYNEKIKDTVKSLRVHIWNNDTKEWEIEYKEFEELQNALPECQFDIFGAELLPKKVDISNFEFKTTPMQHQITGVEYGLDHTRWLLADEMGLGKSKQLIDLAIIRKQTEGLKHCLVICGVNSLKWNWLEEVQKHSDESGWVLGMRETKRTKKLVVGTIADRLSDLNKLGNDAELDSHYFIITNIETIRNAEIVDKLVELCNSGIISMIAVDEIHRVRNLQTISGTNLLQLQPKYRVGMTGTPLINTPKDLYAIFKWLGYQRYSYSSFVNHFCEFDKWGGISGYKNISQLEDQLDSIMLRRTKDQVLDLPDKVYISEYVELTDEQKRLYNQVIDGVIEDPNVEDVLSTDCKLAMYLRLRQVSGGVGQFSFIKKNPKLDRLEQIVEEAVYSGTKVIVFSNWIEAIKPAIARLQKYNPVVITGEINDSDRQEVIHKFQNDDTVKVICCTTKAAGVGITLTAATEVVFLDEPWTNADKEQAIDRAHRIGTTSKVTIHTIMGHDTYDEDVHKIVLGKKDLADRIVDKKSLARLKIA